MFFRSTKLTHLFLFVKLFLSFFLILFSKVDINITYPLKVLQIYKKNVTCQHLKQTFLIFIIMKLTINDNVFTVKLAVTPETIKSGMMGKRFDETFNGMFFLLGSKQRQCFWMKNCIIPLDIIMIDSDTITKIHKNSPPCYEDPCENYCGFGDRVLELYGGTCDSLNIQVGDEVSFSIF